MTELIHIRRIQGKTHLMFDENGRSSTTEKNLKGLKHVLNTEQSLRATKLRLTR